MCKNTCLIRGIGSKLRILSNLNDDLYCCEVTAEYIKENYKEKDLVHYAKTYLKLNVSESNKELHTAKAILEAIKCKEYTY